MKFEISNVFTGIDRNQYIALFLDKDFNDYLESHLPVRERKEIERTDDGVTITRKLRIDYGKKLPAAAAKVVGADYIYYFETSRFRRGNYSLEWEVAPSVMQDKITSRGTITLFEAGEKKVRRVLGGELRIKIFGVGRLVEKRIVEGVERKYREIAEMTQAYINEKVLTGEVEIKLPEGV